jgi:hypothetical protein
LILGRMVVLFLRFGVSFPMLWYTFFFFLLWPRFSGSGIFCPVITVPACSMGSGMMFVELRKTRILIEGNSQFYVQPEVGHVNDGWLLSSVPMVHSECANIASSNRASIAPSTRMSTVT